MLKGYFFQTAGPNVHYGSVCCFMLTGIMSDLSHIFKLVHVNSRLVYFTWWNLANGIYHTLITENIG
jgi:hypothetical protein